MSRKRKIRFKPTWKHFLFFAVTALIVVYLIIAILPDKSVFLQAEDYVFTEDAKIYVFKQQEYILINSSDEIHFLIEEGADVAASSVLSEDYSIKTHEHLQNKIDAVEFMIENPSIDSKWEIYLRISEINDQIILIDDQIDEAVLQEDDEQKKILLEQRAELLTQVDIYKNAMQYIFTPTSELKGVLKDYQKLMNTEELPLTLNNLNFNVFGYIFYTKDGYEDILTMDMLELFPEDYFNYIDHITPNKELNPSQYIIKSCATDRVIIGIRIDGDTDIISEQLAIDRKNKLLNENNMDKEGGYYNFLFQRIDLLTSFPELTVTFKDNTSIKGYFVDVIQEDGDKILMVALRRNISYFNDKTITSADLHLETSSCYAVPLSSIIETKNGSYITVVSNYSLYTEVIPVSVYKTEGDTALLKVSENPDLDNGTEVLIEGEEPDGTTDDMQ